MRTTVKVNQEALGMLFSFDFYKSICSRTYLSDLLLPFFTSATRDFELSPLTTGEELEFGEPV